MTYDYEYNRVASDADDLWSDAEKMDSYDDYPMDIDYDNYYFNLAQDIDDEDM